MRTASSLLLTLLIVWVLSDEASGAQFKAFGETEVHYVVVNTTFVAPEVAERYGLVRGRDRAFVNVSVLKAGVPQRARVTGSFTNLLGQRFDLDYKEVTEAPAVYYLAPFKHSDQDTLRFTVEVAIDGGPAHEIAFQETLYWESQ